MADLYQAAELFGDAVRKVYQHDGKTLEAQGADFQVYFLLGGQIRGEPIRPFQIYFAGNFIEARRNTPFLTDWRTQIRQADTGSSIQLSGVFLGWN